jgi:DNA-binding beta-propeller fold protein YncE
VKDTGWRPPQKLRAVEVIGEPGTQAGQFAKPTAITVDPWGAVYVADAGNHRIQRITPSGNVQVYGRAGTAPGQLWGPSGIAVEPSGQFFYVADQGNNRVQRFKFENGQSQGSIGGLRAPSGVSFDMQGMLWICDTGNGRLLRVNVAAGQFIASFDRAAGIVRPVNVTCDREQSLYVTDAVSNEVTRYNLTGQRSATLSQLRRLSAPRQVAIDSEGRIYVAEAEANRVQVFEANGDSLFLYTGPSGKQGPLKEPSGIAIGPKDEIYVCDTANSRILRLVWE